MLPATAVLQPEGAPDGADMSMAEGSGDTQVFLPFEIDLRIEGDKTTIEFALGRELAASPAPSPVENARVVGTIEGIERLLRSLSLSRAGVDVDLSQTGVSEALKDCVERLR